MSDSGNVRSLAFIDTNVLGYAYSKNDLRKKAIAINAFNTYECIVGTHVLNEFCNVCIKKLHFPIDKIHRSINEILDICDLFVVKRESFKMRLMYMTVTNFHITIVWLLLPLWNVIASFC
ncbi:hypothetical protein AGMMS4952_22880 [Spirochaetia bacterium]|nr:hypothetical protein AGMMS4952_22880 [Spirochaetia bacterium]